MSLLNVDVKIMSKVFATKIKNVLPTIVHHNQTGFINDRIFDLMDFTLSKKPSRATDFYRLSQGL